jgi:hypothetical protein
LPDEIRKGTSGEAYETKSTRLRVRKRLTAKNKPPRATRIWRIDQILNSNALIHVNPPKSMAGFEFSPTAKAVLLARILTDLHLHGSP